LAFVHPNPEAQAAMVAREHGLDDIPRFSDPEGRLYRAFGLGRARLADFLRPGTIKRYWEAWRAGHRISKPTGDVRLMPGVFLLHNGTLVRAYRHRTPADRPDYVALAQRRGEGANGSFSP
jgi:hypothetical protein